MRKIEKLLLSLLVVFVSFSLIKVSALSENITFQGDLKGGVTISHNTSNDVISWYRIAPQNTNWSNSKGIAIRMKNLVAGGGGSPLHVAVNEFDSDRVMPRFNKGGVNYYPLSGNPFEMILRDFDSAVILPGSFDGYLYIPFATFDFVSTTFGNSSFDLGGIFSIYIGINTLYDAFSNYSVGDIEIVKTDLTTSLVYDGSSVSELSFSNHYFKDYLGENINFTRLSGYESSEVKFDYGAFTPVGDLSYGANISYTQTPNDVLSTVKITPTSTNLAGAKAIVFRAQNNTNINTPIEISLHENSGEVFLFEKTLNTIYFKTLQGVVSENSFRAWDSRMVLPQSFNGYIIIPFDGFKLISEVKNDGLLDTANIYALFFGVSMFYDAFANYKIGDISILKEDGVHLITDFNTVNEEQFSQAFVKDLVKENIHISRLNKELIPAPGVRIGDVKVLESFEYSTNQEIKTQFPAWTGGSTMINTLYPEGGMKVEIGEPIPGNNIFGSIDIFPKGNVTDWTNWKNAKGVTFYIKNLSPKEVTINLEFEEMNGTIFERWNIRYGAMIMLSHKNGDEFIVHAKPVFSIPVGFEGWVRIDFSQYWVPEWCIVGDLILDTNLPITGFFLTTDTTRNEGLSFVINHIGIYYNTTSVSSLFYNPNNSFSNNMKGE